MSVDSVFLAGFAGLLLSLVFEYVPGASDWYEKYTAVQKRGIMVLVLLVASVLIFGASCTGLYNLNLDCGVGGIMELLRVFLACLVANASGHSLLKKPNLLKIE